MAEFEIAFNEELAVNEDVQGSTEFNFWKTIGGLLFGGADFVDEVNDAINLAYSESL